MLFILVNLFCLAVNRSFFTLSVVKRSIQNWMRANKKKNLFCKTRCVGFFFFFLNKQISDFYYFTLFTDIFYYHHTHTKVGKKMSYYLPALGWSVYWKTVTSALKMLQASGGIFKTSVTVFHCTDLPTGK